MLASGYTLMWLKARLVTTSQTCQETGEETGETNLSLGLLINVL
jgi:hypothetical protein